MINRRSRLAAPTLALLAAVSAWLSLGTVALSDALTGGDTVRIAALPSFWVLAALAVAAVVAAAATRLDAGRAWPLAISVLVWLPYLPLPVPAAFLVWQGPLEVAVWLAVVAGLAAVRRPVVPDVLRQSAFAAGMAAVVLAALSITVFSQVRGVIPGGDEPHYLAATQSLLQDADLRVANNYADGDYLDYFPGRLEPHFLRRSTDGDIYSIHAPGVSVVILPGFAVAGYAGAVLTMVLIAALSSWLAWRLAFRITASGSAAWAGVVAVFATAPYFFHTFTIYPEVIGGCCVLAGVWLLLDLVEGRAVGARALAGTGAALALLPWLHSRFAVLAAMLGLVLVVRLFRLPDAPRRIALLLSVPVIAAVGWFAFFYLIWGSPNPTAPYGVDTGTSASYVVRGLIGLLVDQQFGVLTTAPIYAVAAAGALVLLKQQPRLTIELASIVVPYVVIVASYAMWWAGSAAPARFLVAILPLAVLPIAAWWKQRRSVFVALLLLFSVALILPRAFVEGGRLIFNSRGAIDGTLAWLSHVVNLPMALPSVHRDGGFIAIRDGAVWIAALVAAAAVASRAGRRSAAASWTASALAMAVAVMAAFGTVSSLRGVTMLTPERSKLAAIGAMSPAIHGTFVDLGTMQPIGRENFLNATAIDLAAPASRLDRVPAGDYAVGLPSPLSRAGELTMFVGRNDPPIESPSFDDLRDGGFRLRLPVAVQTLNFVVKDDEPKGSSLRSVVLRPIAPAAPAHGRNALRATRYGRSRAFFFDEWAYLERDGFWTRANGTAVLVIDTPGGAGESGLPLSITAGAVPTTVRISTAGLDESFSLEAGQRQDVVLPPSGGNAWTLRIRSGPGFRPSEREPGSRDVRELAAWVALLR